MSDDGDLANERRDAEDGALTTPAPRTIVIVWQLSEGELQSEVLRDYTLRDAKDRLEEHGVDLLEDQWGIAQSFHGAAPVPENRRKLDPEAHRILEAELDRVALHPLST